MTAGDDQLFVTVGGRDVGLEALLKKVDAEMAVSADRAVRLGQSYARLAQAQGSPTAAANILAGTMQRAGAASEQSLIGISTQAARLQNSSGGLQASIAGLGGQLSGLGGTAGQLAGSIGNLAGSFGTLGTVGAAIGLGKVVVDLSVASANTDLLRERFDSLAVSAGTTGEALITALRSASGGEISDLNLTLAANKAQLLGVADSAEEFSVLMGIARDRAQQMGISTTQAFNDLTTGLGRGSALILDNLGIIVSVKEANEQYAAALGKTAGALTEAEQKQALINQVLAQGRASLDATGGAVASTAGQFQQLGASLSNYGSAVGSVLANVTSPAVAELNRQVQQAATSAQFWLGWFGQIGTTSAAAAAETQANASATAAYSAELERSGSVAQANAAYEAAHAASLQQSAQAAGAATGPMQAAAAAQIAQAQAAQQATAAQQQAATAILGYAGAASQSAEASVLDAAQKAAQQAATAQLTAATNEAVSAFLALYPTIDAAGIASAVTAGKIPPLIGQLAALRVAAYSTRDAIAALAAQQGLNVKSNIGPGGVGVNAPGITSGRNNDVAAVLALQKANQDAADARSAQVIALGTQQQKVNEYERQYAAAVKASGADSAAAINAETRLKQARADAAKPAKGGGGGGTRLSDQQKLQNSLLASQEQYEQKSEDAATQHAIDVEQINRDFYAKMQDAQRDFEQSLLDGDASFYGTLIDMENQGAAQRADAQYQAFLKDDLPKIAAEKGADVAEAYQQAYEKVLLDRARREAEIEKATADKNTGRADALRGVDAKERAAEDARLARIKEGEGSIASERNKQLDEAAAKEADAQDKIGLSADRAADKKIAASARAGAAIDAELAKAGALADTYDRVGNAGSRAGITPAAGAATTPPIAAPVANAAPTDQALPGLADLISALVSKLDEVKSAIVRQESETTSAVRRISNTGNIGA